MYICIIIPIYLKYNKFIDKITIISDHHLHLIMVLKGFKDAISFLLGIYYTFGIVAMKFTVFGGIAVCAVVFFVTHRLLDHLTKSIFVSAYDLEAPLCGIYYLWLV